MRTEIREPKTAKVITGRREAGTPPRSLGLQEGA